MKIETTYNIGNMITEKETKVQFEVLSIKVEITKEGKIIEWYNVGKYTLSLCDILR